MVCYYIVVVLIASGGLCWWLFVVVRLEFGCCLMVCYLLDCVWCLVARLFVARWFNSVLFTPRFSWL